MVVVHPDEVARLQHPDELAPEQAVDAEIGCRFPLGEMRKAKPVMADGPKSPIGESEVIFVDVALGEIGHREGDTPDLPYVEGVRINCRAGIARPAEPDPAMLLEGRVERDGEAAWAGSRAASRNGNAIGDHDQTAPAA